MNNYTGGAPKWYEKIPSAFVILFFIICAVCALTYVVPSGEFQRTMVNGRNVVVAGSFTYIEKTANMTVDIWGLFKAIPVGMVAAGPVMMIVFLAGGMFKILERTRAIENAIGITIRTIGVSTKSKQLMLVVLTFVFGFFGAVVGFENVIAFVPLGIMVALAMGYDLMVGAGIVIGGVAIGFGTSPINPYSIGIAHAIAELPIFSGMGPRTLYCIVCLLILIHHISQYMKKIETNPAMSLVKGISTDGLSIDKERINDYKLDTRGKLVLLLFASFVVVIVFGVIKYNWYLTEISALFVLYAILFGLIARFHVDEIANTFVQGASEIAGGAMIVGFARSIMVILEQGKIGDTIINALAAPLVNFPPVISAILMTLVQGVINFFVPSGSGQAMATMPIIIPLSDLIGVNRQIAVQAFQMGDGFLNLIIPTAGGLLAMLALARVPFDKWCRFVVPVVVKCMLVGWIFLAIATYYNWQ
ncbi:MAG: AbgT family transporter [Sporomusaceae bacterium]|nr:AbgT family transporter [Sporomusaceae bacterium]